MNKIKNQINPGDRFGKLTVVGEFWTIVKGGTAEKPRRKRMISCICDCGKRMSTTPSNLKQTKSCGCSRLGKTANKVVARENPPEFSTWKNMRSRCNNSKDPRYHQYGGRGITICERWGEFKNFYEDMGSKPSKSHSIDRIDVNGNYEPSNCRWALPKEQSRNRTNNRIVEYKGESRCLTEWAELLGYEFKTLACRIDRGWDIEKAFTEPTSEYSDRKNKLITFNGKSMNYEDWSKETGLPQKNIIERYFKKGWSAEKTLTTPVRKQASADKFTYNGESHTCPEWDKKMGFSKGTIRERMRKGMSFEEAISKPKTKLRTMTLNGEEKTVKEWSAQFGLKCDTVMNRLNKGWSPERCLGLEN